MKMLDIIAKKRDGFELSPAEIDFLVKGISDGSIPDYQISAWAMALYFQGMTETETRNLAMAMAYSGEVLDLSGIKGIKVDKHSTGGVGDKTTLVVIPLVAAAGVPVAKMSGRGLGHTGGTIDKFESIPGFQVQKSHPDFVSQVNRVKAAVISQSGNLVPADKRLYAIRDVTATVESIPLIASSIMSKKIASGAQGIVLDVKVGQGAFMKDCRQAVQLARTMIDIGRGAGRKVVVLLTDMNQPLGKTVGNALEVREAIDTLKAQGPSDLEDLSLCLAAHLLVLGGKFIRYEDAWYFCRGLLISGKGLEKLNEMIKSQKGSLDFDAIDYGLPRAPIKEELLARRSGYICELNALEVGRAAMHLGAGREKIGDRIDFAVGIELLKKIGDEVRAGEPLAIIHASDKERLKPGRELLENAYRIEGTPEPQNPLVIETITD